MFYSPPHSLLRKRETETTSSIPFVDRYYFFGFLYQSLACLPSDLTHVANFG